MKKILLKQLFFYIIMIIAHECGHLIVLYLTGGQLTGIEITFQHCRIFTQGGINELIALGGVGMNFLLVCIFQKISPNFAIYNVYGLLQLLTLDGTYL